MIIRIWHGWTDPVDADAYQQLLETDIVPAILARNIPGLHHLDVLRREADGDEVEFVTLMWFDGWSAVEAFVGERVTTSVVPDTARRLLRRYDADSHHYDLVGRHPSGSVGLAVDKPTRREQQLQAHRQ